MSKAIKSENWRPTDHVCRECGGRVVQVTNSGPTGGGNPIFRCADCEIGSASMGPECICWCGMKHKGQLESKYRCMRVDLAKTDPTMAVALLRSGFSPENTRVAIAVVSEDSLRAEAGSRRLIQETSSPVMQEDVSSPKKK